MAGKKAAGGTKGAPGPEFAIPPGWKLDAGGKSMSLAVETKDFLEAVSLINAIAPIAEEVEHHPDFHLERWNQLRVTTYSHDVGKLTKRDLRLALRINEVLARRRG
jgi:4a-hydroxytetrahydrobiopterin dehydratase